MSRTLPNYSLDTISEATCHAGRIERCLLTFRRGVGEKFPHRIDAIDVVKKVEQTLRDQHGGLSPFKFLYHLGLEHFEVSTAPEDRVAMESICQRWMDQDAVGREFSIFYPLDDKKRGKDVLNEERITEIVIFLQEWLRNQKG